jgi:hypothetical protein
MTERKRGKPPTEVANHLMLVLQIKERVDKGHSVRNACRLVRDKYYPSRSVGGIKSTYLELTTPKSYARPGAVKNDYGYISADQWELTSQARNRLIDLCRRIEFALAEEAHAKGEKAQPLGLINRASLPTPKKRR